jgi:hypothetical protein
MALFFFLLQTGVFSDEFFRLVWLKDWNNIPWLLLPSMVEADKFPDHPRTIV